MIIAGVIISLYRYTFTGSFIVFNMSISRQAHLFNNIIAEFVHVVDCVAREPCDVRSVAREHCDVISEVIRGAHGLVVEVAIAVRLAVTAK